MTNEQNSLQADKGQDNRQLTQSIINEMQAQGFLDGFLDEKTGEALLEIQLADDALICKIENMNKKDCKQE